MGLIPAVSEEVSPCCIRYDLYASEAPADDAGKPSSVEKKKCPSVITVLSSLLERVVTRNERLPPPSTDESQKKFAEFSGLLVPTISIE
ncbi:hypothetical protein L7F22_039842 [Adiantum nelumboides]|nr:hypothetical protein [Adiantum nelumboides]